VGFYVTQTISYNRYHEYGTIKNMELPTKLAQIKLPDKEAENLQELRRRVNKLVDEYLMQYPRPSLSDFAEIFGASEYIEENKKRKTTIIHVGEFKERIVQKIWNTKKDKETIGKSAIPQSFHMVDMVILPPDDKEVHSRSGEEMEEMGYIPRTEHVRELLDELGASFVIIGGKNSKEMIRRHTYFIFFLEESRLAIFVNNEEGNATFIFHDVVTLENALFLAQLTKKEIKEGKVHEFPLHQINWNGDKEKWKEEILEAMTKQNEGIHIARSDWVNMGQIRLRTKRNSKSLEALTKQIIEENPELACIKKIASNNREVLHYPPKLLEIILQKIKKTEKKAPTGWVTLHQITQATGVERGWLERQIKKIEQEDGNKKGIEMLTTDNKHVYTHYPPEILEVLHESISQLPKKAPDDWVTIKKIRKTTQKSWDWINKRLPEILKLRPDLEGKEMRSKTKNITIYYPPELLNIFIQKTRE